MNTNTPTHCSRTRLRQHNGIFAFLTVLLMMAGSISLSSCTGYTSPASGGQTSNPGAGVLTPSSSSVSFGNVAAGGTASQTISVTNTGTATVNVSQVTVTGATFTMTSGNGAVSIPAGQSASVQVQFAPTTDANSTGTLTVTSDASNSPLAIALSGTGTEAILQMSPASLSFNNVTVGQMSSQSVTLTNNGNSNLVVNSATVSGTGFGMSGLAMPKTISAGQNATFSVQFTPTSTTGATGSIVFSDNAGSSPQTMTLTGSALAAGSTLSANPGSVNFGNVVVSNGDPQTITLTNSGNAAITVNQVNTAGSGFSVTGLTVGQTIAAGGTTQFSAAFDPTTAGQATGTISIGSTATDSTLTIPLTGTGTQGALSANPASINFGNVAVNGNASVSVTLSNPGTAAVSITGSSISGTGFSMGSLAAQTLNPGQTASFNVTFGPTSAASDSGSVSITSNAPGSPLKINLSGAGTQAQISANPLSVGFGNVAVGNNSSVPVTLKNNGNSTLTFSQISVTGTGMSQTGLSTSTTIAAGGSVNFNAIFTPSSATAISGSITLTTNGAPSPLVISMTGTGTQPQISANPSSVNFGSVSTGNSNTQQITLQNNGNATLTFSQVTVSGTGFSLTGLSTSTTIAAGGSMNFNAIFTPSSVGAVSGSITLTTNGTPSSLTISLSGTGSSPTLSLGASPTTLSFGNVNDGTNSSLTSLITNNGNSSITISGVTTSGAGFSANGVSNGMVLTAGQSATLTVTFAPTNPGAVTGASVTIASNATNSPITISLSGTGTHSVLLQWDASTTSNVTYNVFRATTPNGFGTTPLNVNPISALSYTDTNVTSGQQYYYVVQAVNGAGSSGDSNPANVTIPTP